MIDDRSLKKYRHFKGAFRNRLHNDIDWKEQAFRQYDHRCAFLNEENLCDIYSETGPDMLCDTCRKYPRHIEEFEGLREYSLSLSCPEAARIFLSRKEKTTFVTIEKETPDETYDDFDYLLFTALMDTRDYLISIVQDRSLPMELRRRKLLACAHDFQLALDKNELYQWEDIRARHQRSGVGNAFLAKLQKWTTSRISPVTYRRQVWKLLFLRWKSCVKDGMNISMRLCCHFMVHAISKKSLPPASRNSWLLTRTGKSRKSSSSFTGSTPTSAEPSTMTRSSPK